MARPDLQQVTLDDFSAGIYDDWFARGGAMAAPPGAAQRHGTFGCVASVSGGLMPGPKRVNRIQASIPAGTYAPGDANLHVMAFRNASPVWDRTTVGSFESGRIRPFPDCLAFAFEYYDNGYHKAILRVYKMFKETDANPAIDTVTEYTVATHSSGPYAGEHFYGFCGIDMSRSRTAAPAAPGWPFVAMVYTDNRDVREYERKAYPNDGAAGTDSSGDLTGLDQAGGFAGYSVFAHQDRLLLLDRSANIGLGLDAEIPTDIIVGSAPNDYSTVDITVEAFVSENPGLFGSWHSVNASEAIFIKQQRGGFVVRGDVKTPVIVRLPGLPSTGEAINIGVNALNGMYVYGSVNGVFGWSGGDTAMPLSPMLNGWFWKPDRSDTLGVDRHLHTKGSFTAVGKYVFAPNNFILDINQAGKGGWWRLNDMDDPDNIPYAWWDCSAGTGCAIGAPVVLNETQTVLADYYDINQGQPSYSWTSQPLHATMNRVLDFREVDLMAQGHGMILVTLTGIDGASDSVEFEIDSDVPQMLVSPVGVRSHDVIVRFDVRSLDGTTEAPKIARASFGYIPRETSTGVVS